MPDFDNQKVFMPSPHFKAAALLLFALLGGACAGSETIDEAERARAEEQRNLPPAPPILPPLPPLNSSLVPTPFNLSNDQDTELNVETGPTGEGENLAAPTTTDAVPVP